MFPVRGIGMVEPEHATLYRFEVDRRGCRAFCIFMYVMPFIYHFKPKLMRGTTLFPLNELKGRHPEAFSAHVKKYVGRESLMKVRLPLADCAWNDVLHFSTLDLKVVLDYMKGIGIERKGTVIYYRIPISALAGKTVFYFKNNAVRDPGVFNYLPDEFEVFDEKKYEELSDVPETTKSYMLREVRDGNKRVLRFKRSPHVLVKGRIEVLNEWERRIER